MFIKWKHCESKILWRAKEAAALTGGINSRDWMATGVCINVDSLQPGDLFFAAHGDNLEKVFAAGAAAAVIPHGMNVREDWPCLKVANSYEALRSFAKAARFKTHALIIAVQGEQERGQIAKSLSQIAQIHEGGRHLSSGLAALPENITYGIFGFSPSSMPDIAIVTDPEKAAYARVFNAMPRSGVVLMDCHALGYVECLAAAKAAGIQHIYTFDEAAHMNLKAVGSKSTQRALKLIAESVLRSNIKAFDPLAAERFTAFQVKNVVDLGMARKTLILENIRNREPSNEFQTAKDLEVPMRIRDLNLVYTSKQMSLSPDEHRAIHKSQATEIRDIVPEVLSPGDYLVFRKPATETKAEFSSALRAVGGKR